ncbi:hypothetical protein BH11BAC3_BH11BAC3_14340 [soil metagenome]
MKKSSTLVIILLFSFAFASCYKKYSRTITVCDGNLYLERYRHNLIDVAYYYLTDSSNFRIYVGKFDNEHGGYSIKCQNDSIKISETFEGKVTNMRKYSLVDLVKGKEGF